MNHHAEFDVLRAEQSASIEMRVTLDERETSPRFRCELAQKVVRGGIDTIE